VDLLASGKESSLWLLGLLGMLGVASWFRSQTKTPILQSAEANPLRVTIDSFPPRNPIDNEREAREKRKEWQGWVNVGLSALTLVALVAYACTTHKQLEQMIVSNGLTRTGLNITQQADVTIGRPDGVVAEIATSKDQSGIIVYFQNNGHLPAKFNWGNSSKIIEFMPEDPNALTDAAINQHFGKGKEFDTENWWQPMWRARNRKTGALSWSGTSMIGGNSLYAGALWELPRERMAQLQKWDHGFVVRGTFESCDSFHNYTCRNFILSYRREPYSRFVLVGEDECMGTQKIILRPDPDLDYLPACSTESEREETQVPKGLTPAEH
jgi:hypothetical protein